MAEFSVSAKELRSKASELRNQNQAFKGQVDDLAGQEGQLITMWDGQAKDAFHKAFEHDKNCMEDFHAIIEDYCRVLDEIAQKYEDAERKNLDIANQRNYK